MRPETLGLLHRFGAVAHAELAIQRGGVLLDGVRAQEQLAGDLAVGRARATASRTSRSRSESGGPAGDSCGLKTVMPRPTMRTAPAMSAAGQSLEMKPEAPAALRRVGADAAGAGDQQDVEPRARARAAAGRSPRRTPGRRTGPRARRAGRSGARARAPPACCARSAQRSTHGCSPSIIRRPQCTTSWSSTTSTRSLRSLEPAAIRDGLRSGPVKRHRQSHAPVAGLALAELDDPADLQRLERGELEAHAALARPCRGRRR